jgi:hypothetical protein
MSDRLSENRRRAAKRATAQAALAAAILMTSCVFLHAEQAPYEGTWTQRRACRPDVLRLCGPFIPDRVAITQCLDHNKPRLSPDCLAVMEGRLK